MMIPCREKLSEYKQYHLMAAGAGCPEPGRSVSRNDGWDSIQNPPNVS